MALITSDPLDYSALIESVRSPSRGALALFLGTVRDIHQGREVDHLDYEAYGGMALKQLTKIEEEATRRWPGVECRILHRVGRLDLGEISVAIAAASAHRAAAFEACRYAIETIKKDVPIWKKETFADGEVTWVDPTG